MSRQYRNDREIIEDICEFRKRRNALILVHNYQLGEVQDIGDFVGDSLELSRKAADNDAELIVFCGVTFMAETAAILSPEKTVLLPVLEAGCPMADMADAEEVRAMKAENPNAVVVTYVNSTAAVKAESDICVTSANALKIVSSLPPDRPIIFVPDMNLGAYVQRESGREMILWPGYCPTHMRLTPEMIVARKQEFPDAKVIVHPESRMEVIDLADAVLSTGGMCRYARENEARQIIVATELGMIYRLQRENPDKQFIPVSEQAICPNMKMIRLPDILRALDENRHIIRVDTEIRNAACRPIEKMLEMSR